MPIIRLFPALEGKSWRALLDTEEPVHCFKSKEGKLYLVSHRQLEVLKILQLPFEEIQEDAKTSATV
ncbi:hypothetical protein HYR99_01205 [Candidatus Poribacteria bacterium]|nr:hypothetical protein [Candidatus Poribacteria bacterium]